MLTALVGRLSMSVVWENGPEQGLSTVLFKLSCNLSKQCRPRSDGISSGSALFANVPDVLVKVLQITLHEQHPGHSDKTSMAINNCHLDSNRLFNYIGQ